VVETVTHAGRSVIVSGSTVAIGLLSMVIIPIPVIRSIGIGGLLIPTVSVIVAITMLPALLSLLGHRINSVRVMPRKLVEGTDLEAGFWWRWAHLVMRRPVAVGAVGVAIVALLLVPASKLNPAEAQAKDLAGAKTADAVVGLDRLTGSGVSPGATKPFVVLVEHNPGARALKTVVSRLESTPGIDGASAPAAWRKGDTALVEAIPSQDGAAKPVRHTISNLQDDVLPALESELGGDVRLTLGGVAPEEVPYWINAANAVLVPSEQEGFGLSVIEAIACGVPAFGTPVSIHPVALQGIEGTYCAPYDREDWRARLAPILADPDPRVNGRRRAELFSADRMAARVVAAWRELVEAA
jgi:predicted RND superfamily exporter protein